jgi:hypothetical protein
LDENEGPTPTGPYPAQRNPEEAVAVLEGHIRLPSLQDHELLSKGHVLEGEIAPAPQARHDAPDRNPDPIPHHCPLSLSGQESSNLAADRVFATHSDTRSTLSWSAGTAA